ncbi:MAG: hypothetical protein ABSG08_14960 [Terriglobales bacterium]
MSIRPYKHANAPSSLGTMLIPALSMLSLSSLSTESVPFQHNVPGLVYRRANSGIDTRIRNSRAGREDLQVYE